jgi:acyl-coenzyme A thioesterase PaaI-like protein
MQDTTVENEEENISVTDIQVAGVESHANCLLCGHANPNGLKLQFEENANGEVSTVFQGKPELQGYGEIMHGGVISALLDSAMTNCLFKKGIEAFTGELRVRYLKPVPCTDELIIRAWVTFSHSPFFQLRSEVTSNDVKMAWAEAKFMLK